MLCLRFLYRFILICLVLLGLSVSSANAAILNVDSEGNLLGASAVVVGGSIYDVEFHDGFCGASCDLPFVFDNVTSAEMAAQALLDQVFIDVGAGDFDSSPELTIGCEGIQIGCSILIPYSFSGGGISGGDLLVASAGNNPTITSDNVGNSFLAGNDNLSLTPFHTWALFTPTPVPIPAAIWLFGTALIGLVGFNKRKKAA